MALNKEAYFNEFKRVLMIAPARREEVIKELLTHYEEEVRELVSEGLSEEEASELVLEKLGSPKKLAQEFYRAYSTGSLKDAILSSLPHLMVSLLFLLHLFENFSLTFFTLLFIGITIYEWKRKPFWFYSWLGYSLLSTLALGFLFWYFFSPLSPIGWALLSAYGVFGIFVFLSALIPVLREDWLLLSFTLLPFPISGALIYEFILKGEEGEGALSFLILGIISAIFTKTGERIKRALLIILGGVLLCFALLKGNPLASLFAMPILSSPILGRIFRR